MARGSTSLDNSEYDSWLASNKKEKELRLRNEEKRKLSKNIVGWHFGHGTPFKAENKAEFKKELERRGMLMKDEMRQVQLADGKKVWVHK